jgi:DNA-binding LytR/AlgR family response regulator
VLSLVRSVEEHRRDVDIARVEARNTGRLTLKSGGRTLLLDAKSLEWAQAAANYVDIRANGTTYLARMSLTALEQQLAEAGMDVVRVHRSRIVSRAKIVEIVPSRDGDFRIRTADGSELRGSRRYRKLLPA